MFASTKELLVVSPFVRSWGILTLSVFILHPWMMAASHAGFSPSGFSWSYEYDSLGRIASITDPGQRRTKVYYQQDSRGTLNGVRRVSPNGSTVELVFDKYGRRTRMTDDAGTVRYGYDTQGCLVTVHRNGKRTLAYTYDTLGRLKTMTVDGDFRVDYTYDFRKRLEKITTPKGEIRFEYNEKSGEVIRRLPNGITTRWTHQPDGRLTSITHTSQSCGPLASYKYTYRLDGLIVSIEDTSSPKTQTQRYHYDAAQRLISVSAGQPSKIEYAYDAFGNRTSLHRPQRNPILARYNWLGQLTEYDGLTCRHDTAGNLIDSRGNQRSFTFNDDGLVKSASVGSDKLTYRYDGDGLLIGRRLNEVSQTIIPNPLSDIWQPLMVESRLDQPTYYVWDDTSPLMSLTGEQVSFFLHDHLGSVRLVTDHRGTVQARLDSSPFGCPNQNPIEGDLRPGFAGLFFDSAASVYLTRARAYDPQMGRFLQPDPEHRVPEGSQKDLSMYTYCGGDPVNYVDLSGAAPVPMGDLILNWLGRDSVWIGRNRSGGQVSYQEDDIGQFPLGDTRIPGNTTLDEYARLHDIEYWVSMHLPKGTQVKVPAPGGRTEYYTSEGPAGLNRVNFRVTTKALSAPTGFSPLSPLFVRGSSTPNPNSSIDYELQYNPKLKAMMVVPYQNTGFPNNDLSDLRNHFQQKNWDGVATLASQYPSPAVGTAYKVLSIASHIADFHAVRNANLANPADVATWGKNVSYTLGTVGLLAPGLAGAAVSGAAGLIDTGITVGQGIRSQTMQNRAIGLIGLPSGPRQRITGTQQLRSHWGTFDIQGTTFSSRGGWALQHRWQRYQRQASSNAWAETNLNRYRTGSGSLITGTVRTAEQRHETSDSLWRRRTRHFSGNVSFNGADFNKRYAEYQRTGIWASDNQSTGAGRGSSFSNGPWGGNRFSGFSDSNIGGIRLTGAGSALCSLGELAGIAMDETNGRLVLIGKDNNSIALPPLRLDDVVTIFRSVYLYGEAPSVSIDPISNRKTERWMKVRHGAATENTYVGWILYEADRLMKSYSLGRDNKTGRKIYSHVPGYRDFHAFGTKSYTPQWERFWIVPASLTRTQGMTSSLTMLHVPLKLKTERMQWASNKLVTAENPLPSPSAAAYSEWFTSRYDQIAKEVRIRPPAQFGMNRLVAIYEELRRIALITAVAETLRDQNIPFPGWMYDYPVQRYPFDKKTPVLRVEGKGYEATGGVHLAADNRHIYSHTRDMNVTQLEGKVHRELAGSPLFASVSVQQDGETYQAVALPGPHTRRCGANVLHHSDVTDAVFQDMGIHIVRHYNSFFDPHSLFGRGWTLDLPQLQPQKQPVQRTATDVQYRTVYQLTSPLNSYSARFVERRLVPALNRRLLVPTRSGEMLGLADTRLQITGQTTKELIFRDGGSWHFDTDGYLVAMVVKDRGVVYRRDEHHRIRSITSWSLEGYRPTGTTPDAEVLLTYHRQDQRVRSIEARLLKIDKTLETRYSYNDAGRLAAVNDTEGETEYAYDNGLVTRIKRDGKLLAGFAYNEQGQLQEEYHANGKKVAYLRTRTTDGEKVAALDPETRTALGSIEYDNHFVPRRRIFEDGSHVAWTRKNGQWQTICTDPDGEGYTVTESIDGLYHRLETTFGEIYTTEFDKAGRVIRLHREGGPTLEQRWSVDGQLQSVLSDDHGVLPSYTEDGELSSILVAPPSQVQTRQIKQYVRTDYSAEGKLIQITDDTGSRLQIDYQFDQPSVIRSRRGAVTIDRNTKGQMTRVSTSWGLTELYDYDETTGNLSRIAIRQQTGTSTEQASIELADCQIKRIHQPDGGETTFNYYQKGNHRGLLKSINTGEELALEYSYDNATQLTRIDLRNGTTPLYRISYKHDLKGRLTGISYQPISDK